MSEENDQSRREMSEENDQSRREMSEENDQSRREMSEENDQSRREMWFAEAEAILQRGSDTHIAFRGHSVAFSSMAIRNAFILNGGALFAGLAFIGAVGSKGAKASFSAGFYDASTSFIIGIVFAALAALMAYLNYESHSLNELHSAHRNFLKKSEEFFPKHYKEQKDKVAEDYKFHDGKIEHHSNTIKSTQKWAVGFGVASYICFIAGCIIVGETMAAA